MKPDPHLQALADLLVEICVREVTKAPTLQEAPRPECSYGKKVRNEDDYNDRQCDTH
jgi:hypothetical protein